MNIKKVYTYLISLNYEEGFLRLAVLATPFWIIYLGISEGFTLTPETISYVLVINPITAYIFIRWIVIPPIKWVLKGFSNND